MDKTKKSTRAAIKLAGEDRGVAGSQQRPTAPESSIVRSAVPDLAPAPARSTPRPGGKAKRKTDRAVDSDKSDYEGMPRAACDRDRLGRIERLMEQVLHRDRLREMESSHHGSYNIPMAAPYPGLHSASPSTEGSTRSQFWAGSEEGFAEETTSVQGVQKQENLLEMVSKFAQPEQTGQPLELKLASSIDYLSFKPLQEQAVMDTTAKYLAPVNCVSLNVPVVNSCIWDTLERESEARRSSFKKS